MCLEAARFCCVGVEEEADIEEVMVAVVVQIGSGVELGEGVEEGGDIKEVDVPVVVEVCLADEKEDFVVLWAVELALLVEEVFDEVHVLAAIDPLVVCGPESGVDGELVMGVGDGVMGGVDAPLEMVDCLGWVVECDLAFVIWAEEGDGECLGLVVCEVADVACVDAALDVCIVIELDSE